MHEQEDQFWPISREKKFDSDCFLCLLSNFFSRRHKKQSLSRKISERKSKRLQKCVKRYTLFKHLDLLACMVICNSCETT